MFPYHLKVTMCKSLDQSNSVCEYEVNRLANENVIREKRTLTQIVNDARHPDGFTNIKPKYSSENPTKF